MRRLPQARLQALPFAVRCRDCEHARETAERRERLMARRRGSLALFLELGQLNRGDISWSKSPSMDWGGSVGRRSRLLMNTAGQDLVAVNDLGAPTNVE